MIWIDTVRYVFKNIDVKILGDVLFINSEKQILQCKKNNKHVSESECAQNILQY